MYEKKIITVVSPSLEAGVHEHHKRRTKHHRCCSKQAHYIKASFIDDAVNQHYINEIMSKEVFHFE